MFARVVAVGAFSESTTCQSSGTTLAICECMSSVAIFGWTSLAIAPFEAEMKDEREEVETLSDAWAERDAAIQSRVGAEAARNVLETLVAQLRRQNDSQADTIREIRNTSARHKYRVDKLEAFLEGEGYRRCDIAACNCGSWHQMRAQER